MKAFLCAMVGAVAACGSSDGGISEPATGTGGCSISIKGALEQTFTTCTVYSSAGKNGATDVIVLAQTDERSVQLVFGVTTPAVRTYAENELETNSSIAANEKQDGGDASWRANADKNTGSFDMALTSTSPFHGTAHGSLVAFTSNASGTVSLDATF